jgi:hypothetical protein
VVREELFELDTRFGQLGESSIFAQLDAQGLLRHHVPGVDNIEHAVSHPPTSGRAQVRGEVIARLTQGSGTEVASSTEHMVADWQGIWDLAQRRFIDLSDPFESSDEWRPMNARDRLLTHAGRLTEQLTTLSTLLRARRGRRPDDNTR